MEGPKTRQPSAALSADPKARLARLYSSVAGDYDAKGPPFFTYAGARLVEVAGVAPGESVLDVGAGRGAALLPAAERVGPAGRVVGIDLAGGMVAHTRAAIERRGLSQAAMQQMDAEALAFPNGTFDRVLCSFAVFFFPNLGWVLGEMRRVLRAGGTVGFAFTRGADPRWEWYEALLRDVGAFESLPPCPGSGGVRRPDVLTGALAAAGFGEARETVEGVDLFYPGVEAWWESLWTHGSRVPLERLPPDVLDRVKAACFERARLLLEPRGLRERFTFAYVTGRKP